MELEEFLKTFLGIDSIEPKEDGTVALTMLAKDGGHEQCVKLVFAPNTPGTNITQLEKAFDAKMDLLEDWARLDIEQAMAAAQCDED